MTTEDKLKAIMDAQKRGDEYLQNSSTFNHLDSTGLVYFKIGSCHVLEILLHTDLCKVAYPTRDYTIETGDRRKDILLNTVVKHIKETGLASEYYEYVTMLILYSWHSVKGNNWKAAIDSAYELLPSNNASR